ncbi:MAG: NPCBM/NEW2 domain-containing protein, partial [Planctomycetota bacterium]
LVQNLGADEADLTLSWDVRDRFDEPVVEGAEANVRCPPGRCAVRELSFAADGTGPYVAGAGWRPAGEAGGTRTHVYPTGDPAFEFTPRVALECRQFTKVKTGVSPVKDPAAAAGAVAPGEGPRRVLGIKYDFNKQEGATRRDFFDIELPGQFVRSGRRLRTVTLRLKNTDLGDGRGNDTRGQLFVEDFDGRVRSFETKALARTRSWETYEWRIDSWRDGVLSYPLRRVFVRFYKTRPKNWGMLRGNAGGLMLIDHARCTADDRASLRFSVPNGRRVLSALGDVRSPDPKHLKAAPAEAGREGDRCLGIELADFRGDRRLPLVRKIPGAPVRLTMRVKSEAAGLRIQPVVRAASERGELSLPARSVAADGEWQRLQWLLPGAGQGKYHPAWAHVLRYPLSLSSLTLRSAKQVSGRVWIDEIAFDSQLAPDEMLAIDVAVDAPYAEGTCRPSLDVRVRSNAPRALELPLRWGVRDARGEVLLERTEEVTLRPGASLELDLDAVDFFTTEGPHEIRVELPAVRDGGEPVVGRRTVVLPNAAFVVEDFETGALPDGGRRSRDAARKGRYGLESAYEKGGVRRRIPLRRQLPGYASAVGMWVHGKGEDLRMRLRGRDYGRTDHVASDWVRVDWTGWRFVSFPLPGGDPDAFEVEARGRLHYPYTLDEIELQGKAAADGRVWIDDVSVCTTIPPERLVGARLRRTLPGTTVTRGWTPEIAVENRSLQRELDGVFAWQVRRGSTADAACDWGGAQVVAEGSEELSIPPGGRVVRKLDWRADRAAPFHVRWSVRSRSTQAALERTADCMVVPTPREGETDPAAALGDADLLRTYGRVETDMLAITWNELEPRPGMKNFGPFDRRIRSRVAAGVGVVGRLGFSTCWNSPDGFFNGHMWTGDAYAFPRDLRCWYEYVYETVRRYKRWIDCWEVWPHPKQAAGAANMSLKRYLRLLSVARAAIRHADPDARVAMGTLGAEGMNTYLPRFLDAGGGELVDVVLLDPIDLLLSPEAGFLQQRVGEVVDQVERSAPAAEVWVNQLNWSTADAEHPDAGVAESVQADFLVRGKTLCRAAGADRVLVGLDRGDSERPSASTAYRAGGTWNLKPAFLANRVFDERLGAARHVAEVFLPDRAFRWAYCHLFETEEHAVAMMWRRSGHSRLTLPDGAEPIEARDVYGNREAVSDGVVRLGHSPVYLYFDKADLGVLRERLPVAGMEYRDHEHSRWKRDLLDWVDTGGEPPKGRSYQAEGRGEAREVRGVYRDGAVTSCEVNTITGGESFTVDVSGLGEGRELLILRRVDLGQEHQKFAVEVDGGEVARYDLASVRDVTKPDDKRFFDLAIPVPAGRLDPSGKGRVTVRFGALDEGTLTTGLTRFYARGDGAVYLSDIDYVAGRQSTMVPRMDENMLGRPLRVADGAVDKGVCTHARARLAYLLGGRFRALHFTPSLEATPESGSVVFEVIVDGKKVYESDVLTRYQTAEPVTVDLSGAQVLQLRLDHGADGIEGDWGVWSDARLDVARR